MMLRVACLQMLLVGPLVLAGYGESRSQDTQRGRGQTPPYVADTVPNRDRGASDRTSSNAGRNVDPVIQAVQMNLAEIQAGKMGAEKAQNPRVKAFANMIVKDHTDALSKLRALPGGESSGVKVDGKHQEIVDRLARLTGTEFDRDYVDTMVSGHEEALMFFERYSHSQPEPPNPSASKTPSTQGGELHVEHKADAHAPSGPEFNPEFTKFAADFVPVIRRHLQLAKQIQELQSGSSLNR